MAHMAATPLKSWLWDRTGVERDTRSATGLTVSGSGSEERCQGEVSSQVTSVGVPLKGCVRSRVPSCGVQRK